MDIIENFILKLFVKLYYNTHDDVTAKVTNKTICTKKYFYALKSVSIIILILKKVKKRSLYVFFS